MPIALVSIIGFFIVIASMIVVPIIVLIFSTYIDNYLYKNGCESRNIDRSVCHFGFGAFIIFEIVCIVHAGLKKKLFKKKQFLCIYLKLIVFFSV